jgi:hypothetical protein
MHGGGQGAHMQQAALEGLSAHDHLRSMHKALCHHQLGQLILLHINVAILRACIPISLSLTLSYKRDSLHLHPVLDLSSCPL